MIECRCELLNTLGGEGAAQYVDHHLAEVRSDGHGRVLLTCPDTGIEWIEEPRTGPYGGIEQRRLIRGPR